MYENIMPEVWNDLTVLEEIGAGSFGKVYKVKDKQDQISAVKVIHIPNEEAEVQSLKKEYDDNFVKSYLQKIMDDFQREIITMKAFKGSQNIVQLEEFYTQADPDRFHWVIYLKMEFLQDLPSYMKEHKMDEAEVIKLGIQMCDALMACEKKKIIHRDIKPDNILVDAQGNYKLGDFGVARYVEKTRNALSKQGTFYFMAPEIYHGLEYGKESDIYSLGIVLYRILNKNRDPFVNTQKKMISYKDRSTAFEKRMAGEMLPLPINSSAEFGEIMRKACAYDVEKRYHYAKELRRDLVALQKGRFEAGTYIRDNQYTEDYMSSLDRFKRMLRQKKAYMVMGMIMIGLTSIFTIRYVYLNHKIQQTEHGTLHGAKPIEQKSWEFVKTNLDGNNSEKKMIHDLEEYDDKIWKAMKTLDQEAFLKEFSNYSEEDYQNFYNDYYLLQSCTDSDLREKYLGKYQENCQNFCHILEQKGNVYYGEVNRYYIQKSENLSEGDKLYSGELLQASMYYRMDYSNAENPEITMIPYEVSQEESDTNQESLAFINNINIFPESLYEETEGNIAICDEKGCINFLFLEPSFIYEGYYRASLIATYINSDKNTISYIIDVKNGMDHDVIMENATVRCYGEDKDFTYNNMNWSVPAGENDTCVITFDNTESNIDDVTNVKMVYLTYDTDL